MPRTLTCPPPDHDRDRRHGEQPRRLVPRHRKPGDRVCLLRVAAAARRLPVDSRNDSASRDHLRKPSAPEVNTMTPAPRGQILVIGAAAMVVLLGIAALVIDLGFSWMLRRAGAERGRPGSGRRGALPAGGPASWDYGDRGSLLLRPGARLLRGRRELRSCACQRRTLRRRPAQRRLRRPAGLRRGLHQRRPSGLLRPHLRAGEAWVSTYAVAANGASGVGNVNANPLVGIRPSRRAAPARSTATARSTSRTR